MQMANQDLHCYLTETINGQEYLLGQTTMKNWNTSKNQELSVILQGAGAFKISIVKAESWLKELQWKVVHYQKQGRLVQNDWVKDKGTWYFMNIKGVMFNQAWLYQGGNWYISLNHQELRFPADYMITALGIT